MGGVLAIDLGTRKTGFAVADPLRILAQPLEGAPLGEDAPELLDHVARLLAEREVDTLLLGMPLDAAGLPGPRAKAVQAFAARLRERFPHLAVVPWDERLTTKEAEALLFDAGYRGRRAKARRDSWSALVLLRDWMESGEPR